jgi:hypothetical protein
MIPGVKSFNFSSYGYNISSGLITDLSGKSVLANSFNVTFLCYSAVDGVYVTGCGSLDGDYVASNATVVETVTGTGGGTGGGGGGSGGDIVSSQNEESQASYDLVRGEDSSFDLEIKNAYGGNMKDLMISVSGINKDYISLFPTEISNLANGQSRKIKVRITAPAYFTEGAYKLNFLITGKLESELGLVSYTEKRLVNLYILEIPKSKADELFKESKQMMDEMISSNLTMMNVPSLFDGLSKSYDEFKFSEVKSAYGEIKKIHDNAFDSLDMINELNTNVAKSEANGVSVLETKKLLYFAEVAFNRGEYSIALERLKEARLTYSLETKGEYSLYYTVKNNPVQSAAAFVGLLIFSIGSSFAIRLRLYKKKLKMLGEEEIILLGLMKVVQRETFEKNHMSMDEYEEAMSQYEKKLSKTIEDKISTESKIANLLKVKGKKKALFEERKKLVELIKGVQDDYLNKKKIETRVYENMLKSYALRLAKVEEEITFYEAQKVLNQNNFLNKIFMRKAKK